MTPDPVSMSLAGSVNWGDDVNQLLPFHHKQKKRKKYREKKCLEIFMSYRIGCIRTKIRSVK